MSRFDFTDKLNFDEVDLTPPDQVVLQIAREFRHATNGVVQLGVNVYEEEITQKQPAFATTIAGMFRNVAEVGAVQDALGKQGEEIHQYEVFLYTPSYKDYRFRLMFLRFGIAYYPVEVFLEQGIANAMNKADFSDFVFTIQDRKMLDEFVESMLTSPYVMSVMQELIRVDQVQKRKKREQFIKSMLEKNYE